MADGERGDETEDPGVELVLNHLKDTRAFEFTGYKRATLSRCIDKRMEQVGVGSHEDYVDYLEVHPERFEPLFNTILINVTSFFRDADAWESVRSHTLPDLLSRNPDGPIRVWSAGCSSGEEAYSAMMLLAESIGADEVKERVKVYATDVDEEALNQARQATYTEREMESVPAELREYFEPLAAGSSFSTDLRRGDLRPARSVAGRSDLPGRPVAVSQHADVFQRRRPGSPRAAVALRARRWGRPPARQRRDVAGVQRAVRPRRRQAPAVPQGGRPHGAGAPAGAGRQRRCASFGRAASQTRRSSSTPRRGSWSTPGMS
jgi:CheR methyltransferase, SAM binding domain/CheR methyltransferase, all-alpha domain